MKALASDGRSLLGLFPGQPTPCRAILVLATIPILLAGCASAEKDWQRAQKRGTVDAYQSYLNRYPGSEHKLEAQKIIEDLAWSAAKSSRSIDAVRRYLTAYPQSGRKAEAERLIDELKLAGLEGLKWRGVDEESILITDGFFYEKNAAKLGYETVLHVTGVERGVFQFKGVVPVSADLATDFSTAIGVTWIFDSPSISFLAGKNGYRYTSKYKGAMIKFTREGVLVRGFAIDAK